MSATHTPQGELRLVGRVHGVNNYILTWYGDPPEEFEFKQFVSQEQLDNFVTENNLILIEEKTE